jgi:peroxiredoxin
MNLQVKGTQSDVAFLLVLLAASLGFNAFLGREWWRARKSAPASSDVLLAKTVPPLRVKTLDGKPETIAYTTQSQPTVLYVFTPSCPWCRRNINNVKHLTAKRATTFRFIGISLEQKGLGAYVAEHSLNFPVYVDPAPEDRSAYHLGNVPQTLVISQDGTVLKSWRGAYQGGDQAEIEQFFEVKLPGFSDDREAAGKQVSSVAGLVEGFGVAVLASTRVW